MRSTLLRSSAALLPLLAFLLIASPALAQRASDEARPSPNAKVSQTIGTTEVDLHYGRPAVKDRDVFGGLQAWGEVWRAGANEPTTITFSDNVEVAGQPLEAGTYNLFIRPNEESDWDVIFTTEVDWGTMFSDATPVLEVQATPEEAPKQEWLHYNFDDLSDNSATLVMHWNETMLPVTITTAE